MIYVSEVTRTFRKMREWTSHLLRRHESIQNYAIGEPGYVPPIKAAGPEVKRHDAATGPPAFEPKAGIYKPKPGYGKPMVGERRKPKAEHPASRPNMRGASRSKKEDKEEEYISAGIPAGEGDEEEKGEV